MPVAIILRAYRACFVSPLPTTKKKHLQCKITNLPFYIFSKSTLPTAINIALLQGMLCFCLTYDKKSIYNVILQVCNFISSTQPDDARGYNITPLQGLFCFALTYDKKKCLQCKITSLQLHIFYTAGRCPWL